MDLELKSHIEAFNKDWSEYKKTNDEILKAKADGKAIADLETKLAEINKQLDAHQDMSKKMAAALNRHSFETKNGGLTDAQIEHKQAFMKWLTKGKGEEGLKELERKALAVSDDTQGGYMVHADLGGRIVKRVFETSNIRQYAAVTTISTDALEGPIDADQANYGWVAEQGSRTTTTNPKIGMWRIPTHEMYAMPAASQKLLDDAAWDPENWLANKVADRFTRVENAAFIRGTGQGQPKGFLAYTPVLDSGVTDDSWITGKKIGYTKTGQAADLPAVPTTSAPTAQANFLIECMMSMKSEYRGMTGCAWGMTRTTLGRIRRLQDVYGQYVWMPGLGGMPSSLLGYPVGEWNDMDEIGANKFPIAFGCWPEAYQIVDRMGIRVLRDPFTSKPHVLFYTTKRVGGDVLNFEALKLIKCEA